MNNTPQVDMFDALLYAAAPYAGRQELEEYFSVEPPMQLSARVKRRIIKRAKRGATPILVYAKRAAMIALVVMAIGFAGVMSIDAVRAALWNAIVGWYEEYIAVAFVQEEMVSAPTEILEYREPRGLGEEFERYEVRRNESSLSVEYENDTVLVIYRQGLLDQFEMFTSNQESEMSEKIEVNGCSGLVASAMTNIGEQLTILWHDDEYAYVLTGNMPVDELLRIAESVR